MVADVYIVILFSMMNYRDITLEANPSIVSPAHRVFRLRDVSDAVECGRFTERTPGSSPPPPCFTRDIVTLPLG